MEVTPFLGSPVWVRYAQITLCALAAMALAGPLSRVLLWFLF